MKILASSILLIVSSSLAFCQSSTEYFGRYVLQTKYALVGNPDILREESVTSDQKIFATIEKSKMSIGGQVYTDVSYKVAQIDAGGDVNLQEYKQRDYNSSVLFGLFPDRVSKSVLLVIGKNGRPITEIEIVDMDTIIHVKDYTIFVYKRVSIK